jgi:hypothetical protein
MLAVIAPFDQAKELYETNVLNVVEFPAQKELAEFEVMTGAAGKGKTVVDVIAETGETQPLPSVTLRE